MTSKRIDKVRQEISLKNLDGIYVNNITNVRYLTGFSGSAGSLLILENDSHFFTDGRYTEQVKEQVKNSTIHIVGGTHIEGIDKNNLLKSGMKIGFESDHTTVTSFNALQNKLSQISWQPTSSIVELIAAVKDREEIESLKTAIEITDIVFDEILSNIKVGVSENQIAADLSYKFKQHGAEGDSYDPIVASGWRSALPHATPTNKTLEKSLANQVGQ